jgi:hypothetical protein
VPAEFDDILKALFAQIEVLIVSDVAILRKITSGEKEEHSNLVDELVVVALVINIRNYTHSIKYSFFTSSDRHFTHCSLPLLNSIGAEF